MLHFASFSRFAFDQYNCTVTSQFSVCMHGDGMGMGRNVIVLAQEWAQMCTCMRMGIVHLLEDK